MAASALGSSSTRIVRPDAGGAGSTVRVFPLQGPGRGHVSRIARASWRKTSPNANGPSRRWREGEHRWRSLTEALPQLVWSATPDGACDYFSTQWTQFTGVPESHLLGWP